MKKEEINSLITLIQKRQFLKQNEKAEMMYKELVVHSKEKSFPEDLFNARAPNESILERQYRRSIYQPETLSLWNGAYSQLNRIFQGKNYKIIFNESLEEGKHQKIFFMKEFPFNNNILSFFKDEVLPIKMVDPNALLCFWKEENQLNRLIILSKDILFQNRNEVLATSGKNTYIYIKSGLVLFINFSGNNPQQYEVIEITQPNHSIFMEPLKGIYLGEENRNPIYKSFFYDAVPILNQILMDSSTLQVCKAAHCFPQRVEYTDPCTAEGCNEGFQYNPLTGKNDIVCPECKGSGTKHKTSPLGVYQLKAPTRLTEGDTQIPFPGVGYVSPNPAILEFLRSEIEINSKKSFGFLGMEFSKSKANGTETAIGKIIEREALFSFLLQILEQIYELLRKSILFIGKLMFKEDFIFPEIKNNSQFRIFTDDEVLAQISHIKKETLPISIKKKYLLDLIPPTNEQRLIAFADSLFAEDEEIIIQKFTAGLITLEQIKLHQEADYLLEELKNEHQDLFALPILEQINLLKGKVEVK